MSAGVHILAKSEYDQGEHLILPLLHRLGSLCIRFISIMPKYFCTCSLNLNPISGVITVKQAGGDSFDRELISRHYLTVEARDDLGKGNRNTAQLVINIEDVNDNAPMFLANKYEARLLENENEFENPLVLEARDLDLNGMF